LLLPTAYLPPISWCAAFWNARSVVIEAGENYQKGSLRNRAYIAGPNGIQRLSIPLVKGKHQQTPIQEVRIAYEEPWQRQHWRTITTAYGNAPYFEHYAGEIQRFYTERFEFLFDFNLELLKFILVKKMGWNPVGRGNIELRANDSGALANPSPTGDGAGVNKEAIAKWVALPHPHGSESCVHYPQVFEDKQGFLPNLSVLDLLFCCGKRGGEILERS
jgi:WbqC-like protein family